MDAKTELKKRHVTAAQLLQKTANPHTYVHGLVVCAAHVAGKLGVSTNTVLNYLSGRTKDGYLTEAITKEFKELVIEPK